MEVRKALLEVVKEFILPEFGELKTELKVLSARQEEMSKRLDSMDAHIIRLSPSPLKGEGWGEGDKGIEGTLSEEEIKKEAREAFEEVLMPELRELKKIMRS